MQSEALGPRHLTSRALCLTSDGRPTHRAGLHYVGGGQVSVSFDTLFKPQWHVAWQPAEVRI